VNKKYYDSGALFTPRVKTENAPDFRGDIELSAELCSYISRKAKSGEEVKINIALWSKQGQYGEYFSAKLKQAWERNEEQRPAPKPIDDDAIPF
jgi:hypothetical protein